jgi:phage-related protein
MWTVEDLLSEMAFNFTEAGHSAEELTGYLMSDYDMSFEDATTAVKAFQEAMESSSGTAERMAGIMNNNLPGSITLMQSAFDGLKTAIYEKFSAPLKEAVDMAAGIFSDLTEAINADGIVGALGSIGSIIASNVGPAFEGLLEAAGPFGEIIQDIIGQAGSLGGAFSEIAEAFQPFIEAISSAAMDALPTVSAAIKGFFDSMQGVGASVIGPIASGVSSLLSAFGSVAGDAIEIVAGAVSMFLDALSDSGAVSSIIGTIADGAGRLISTLSGAAVDVMDGVSAAVGSFMDAFGGGVLTNIISKVADGANSLISAIQKGRADVIESIGAGIKNFLNAFAESNVANIIADIAVGAADFFDAMATVTGNVISDIASGIKTFIDGFDNKGAVGLIEEVAQWVGDLFGFFTGSIAGIITSIADAFSGFGDKVAELWNTAGPSLSETSEAFHAFADNVKQSIDQFMAVCQPVIEWISSVLAVGIQIAIESIIRTFGNLWNAAMDVITFLQEGFGAFVSLIQGDVAGAVEGFRAAWENIKEFFATIGEAIIAPFRTLATVLGDEGNRGVAAIKAPFESAFQWFVSVGTNIVNGIKSGLASAWEGLTSWIGDKVNGLVGGVMDLLGIHSPSTVFAGIGKNIVLGMREGWGDTFGGLESQVDRDVRRLTDTARIGFEDSAIGRSSAAGISSMLAANSVERGGEPVRINLMLDGDVAASALYDPLRRTAFQKGQSSGGEAVPA